MVQDESYSGSSKLNPYNLCNFRTKRFVCNYNGIEFPLPGGVRTSFTEGKENVFYAYRYLLDQAGFHLTNANHQISIEDFMNGSFFTVIDFSYDLTGQFFTRESQNGQMSLEFELEAPLRDTAVTLCHMAFYSASVDINKERILVHTAI